MSSSPQAEGGLDGLLILLDHLGIVDDEFFKLAGVVERVA